MAHHGRTITATTTSSVVDERSGNELLAAYTAGDVDAFGEFFRRYQPFLVAVAAHRIGVESWHDAEDAAADGERRGAAEAGEEAEGDELAGGVGEAAGEVPCCAGRGECEERWVRERRRGECQRGGERGREGGGDAHRGTISSRPATRASGRISR